MPRKLDPNGRTYKRLEADLALSRVDIRQCQKCWRPYVADYCCVNCGDSMPMWTKDRQAEWERKYDHS